MLSEQTQIAGRKDLFILKTFMSIFPSPYVYVLEIIMLSQKKFPTFIHY